MAKKKTYFVTVDTEDIREVSVPQNGIEFEVNATLDEIKEVEMLFTKKDKNAQGAVKYLGKPFDEWGADAERNYYDENLINLFRKLYDLGTTETRNKINELNLF